MEAEARRIWFWSSLQARGKKTNADELSRINMTEVNSANEINNSVPTGKKIKFLQEFQQPMGGHLGMDRTFERIKF